MYSLKVPVGDLVESTSWVGRSVGSASIFMEENWSNFVPVSISSVFDSQSLSLVSMHIVSE